MSEDEHVEEKMDLVAVEEKETKKEKEFVSFEMLELGKKLNTINPVEMERVQYLVLDSDGNCLSTVDASKYKAIVDERDNDVLYGIVTKSYVIVNHRDLLGVAVPILQECGLNHYRTHVHKGKMFSIWLKEEEVEIVENDTIKLGVVLRNSIDGTMGLGIDAFFYRGLCLNEAMINYSRLKKERTMFKKYIVHKKGLTLDKIGQAIKEVVENFSKVVEIARNSASLAISSEETEELSIWAETALLPKKFTRELLASSPSNMWEAYNLVTKAITESRANWFSKSLYYNEASKLLMKVARVEI